MKSNEKLVTVVVPAPIYDKLLSKKKKDGATIQHQVNAILANYFFGHSTPKVKRRLDRPVKASV